MRASVHATANLVTRTDLQGALDRQTEALRTELHKAINGQTWRYVTFTTALFGVTLAWLRWLFPAS